MALEKTILSDNSSKGVAGQESHCGAGSVPTGPLAVQGWAHGREHMARPKDEKKSRGIAVTMFLDVVESAVTA